MALLIASMGSAAAATALAETTLKQSAGSRLLMGAAISADELDVNPHFDQLVAEQFSCLTPGNEMKPDFTQREKGKFTFDAADRIVAFAEAHNLQVVGHTLCWHSQTPKWMYEDAQGKPLSREAALANLKNHIFTVVKHFKGKVKGWDVVNEAVSDGPESMLRDSPARRAIGDDFVLKAFEFAHEADPNVELYYNDYNIDLDYKRDRAIKLVQQIKAAGLRIDGVGIQGHYLLDGPPLAEIERGVQAFSDLGLKVMITELDVDPLPRGKSMVADINATEATGLDPYMAGFPADMQAKLARRYGELFALFARHRQVSRVTIWGVHDGDSWLNNFPVRGRTNYPMLFDRELKPKPAFDAVIDALQHAILDRR